MSKSLNEPFEVWLRMQCFQAPTKEAYNLAKSAWERSALFEREKTNEENKIRRENKKL